jgi:hypothetical protein
MLVELSVVERRYHAVMEVVSGGIPVVEVSERYGCPVTAPASTAPEPGSGPDKQSSPTTWSKSQPWPANQPPQRRSTTGAADRYSG